MPLMKEVASSNLAAIGYDAPTETLAVRFKRGDEPAPEVYHFKSVPPEVAEPLMALDSGIGSAFFKNVRGKFDFEIVPA